MSMERPSKISVETEHSKIPQSTLVIFEDTTNEGIASMAVDEKLPPQFRIYARAEQEYRATFGIYVDFDQVTWNIRRRTFASIEDFEAAEAEDEKRKPKPVDRSRWTHEGALATIRRRMAERR